MSYLLDVNLLIACAWTRHVEHDRATRWLDSVPAFATAPVIQMGFLRVSMSPAFNATFDEAQALLADLVDLPAHRFLTDATLAASLAVVVKSKDVTDAHLVRLARAHRLKLATLDDVLCRQPWAAGIAENPCR